MSDSIRVLSLQPYFAGSHAQFLNGWIEHSRHQWTVLQLPAKHWKWRMRHAAIHFSQEIQHLASGPDQPRWDVIFCSDMMNVTELKGLMPKSVRDTPIVLYFHENQFEYPTQHKHQRDNQLSFTNFISAVSADEIWFNSRFNFDSMMNGLKKQIKHWPDFVPHELIASLEPKMQVHAPGIERPPFSDDEFNQIVEARRRRAIEKRPLRLVWAARWEYDKNPQGLLDGLLLLEKANVDFEISVVGQTFGKLPNAFRTLKTGFENRVLRWGFQESREEYWEALAEADIFISTANHEFFGLSPAEAIAAGAHPMFPNRLAYPELLGLAVGETNDANKFLYDGTPEGLSAKVISINESRIGNDWEVNPMLRQTLLEKIEWKTRASAMDDSLVRS